MYKKESELIFQRYRLITEGIQEIRTALLPFKDEDWYEVAYNILGMRNGDAVLKLRETDLLAIIPPPWNGNEKDKPLFTDFDAKYCFKWFKEGVSGNDLLVKYIDYKRHNLQLITPITQFASFGDFERAVDRQLSDRLEKTKSKDANKAEQWLAEDIIFENDDVTILNGHDRSSNVRIRAVLTKKTGIPYNFCISNPTLAANYYDSYRFKEHGKSQCFYWLFFKNIEVSDRFHICVLGVRKDGTYDWSLRDNSTAEVTWEALVSKYRGYGVDFSKPLKGYNNKTIPDVKSFLKWNEFTPQEIKDKQFRDLVVDKLQKDYSTKAYNLPALQNILETYTTEYERKLIGDALEVGYIDDKVWALLNEYCRNVIVNRIPPEMLKESVVESDVFKNDVKLVHRYCVMLSRSVVFLDGYLLNLMSEEQVETQVRGVWQHSHDVQSNALNLPVYYPSHFSPKLLAEYIAITSSDSNYVKKPEKWPGIGAEGRASLFNYLHSTANKRTPVSEHSLSQAKEAFTSLPHIWTASLLADYYMYVAMSDIHISPTAWKSMDIDERIRLCSTIQNSTNKGVDIDTNLLQNAREVFIHRDNMWVIRTVVYFVIQKYLRLDRGSIHSREEAFDTITSELIAATGDVINRRVLDSAKTMFLNDKTIN